MSNDNVEYVDAETGVVEDAEPTQDAPAKQNAEVAEQAPAEEAPVEKAEKPKRKRNRKTPVKKKTSQFKDWLRVIKSQGNDQPNEMIKLVYNEATNVCELHTQAKRFSEEAEGISDEERNQLEDVRVQLFRITDFEMVNIPHIEPEPQPEQQAEQQEQTQEG